MSMSVNNATVTNVQARETVQKVLVGLAVALVVAGVAMAVVSAVTGQSQGFFNNHTSIARTSNYANWSHTSSTVARTTSQGLSSSAILGISSIPVAVGGIALAIYCAKQNKRPEEATTTA